ncbi:hypothetical protein CKALI_08915 [Corynebacterium kalinowskii]|uniref:Uncharacterized protein n=1 Tax=Corynebacterium kalinowskii TaxID=2675216 RepID=A0A6B8VI01_9CORY|nr:hypothetical protein CKALI_08915 [Corynebacterium kalinowskii]
MSKVTVKYGTDLHLVCPGHTLNITAETCTEGNLACS